VELRADRIEVVGAVAPDYPLQKKRHSFEFLRTIAHLRPRTNTIGALLRVRNAASRAIHGFFQDRGFLFLHSPVITSSDAEGAGEMFRVTTLDAANPPRAAGGEVDFGADFFGREAFLTVSGQLEAEIAALALTNVYTFGPTFRAENSNTSRHLAEFWMVEPEMAFFDLEDLMDMQEQFVSAIIQTVLKEHRMELEIVERDTSHLENVIAPFPRISYDEAIERLHKLRDETDDPEQKDLLDIEWGQDFGSPHETAIAEMFDKPVFVYNYPTEVKAFYMQPVDGRPEVCRSVDLLAPEGYGEITGGSERIHDLNLLEERVKEVGIDPENYNWYLDLRRFGSVPHSGFGLGVERTVAWICGLPHIRETIPYARMLTHLDP
jgi:asparaginyl-tRNA synthetase